MDHLQQDLESLRSRLAGLREDDEAFTARSVALERELELVLDALKKRVNRPDVPVASRSDS